MITSVHLETVYEIEVQYELIPNQWVRLDVKIAEALEALKTGLLRNLAITRVKLFSITAKDSDAVSFVYDIAAAKSGNQPWSLVAETI